MSEVGFQPPWIGSNFFFFFFFYFGQGGGPPPQKKTTSPQLTASNNTIFGEIKNFKTVLRNCYYDSYNAVRLSVKCTKRYRNFLTWTKRNSFGGTERTRREPPKLYPNRCLGDGLGEWEPPPPIEMWVPAMKLCNSVNFQPNCKCDL
jgi:hypothetical protein